MSKCLQVGAVAEIIKDRFYFATYNGRPISSKQWHFFSIDDEYSYDSFYNDFGPYNLAVLYRSFRKFRRKLRSRSLAGKKIVLYTRSLARKRTNAAYLVGSFAVIYLHKTASEAWKCLKVAEPPYFLSYIDAALGPVTYRLNLESVLRGVEKAVQLKLLDFERFVLAEYEYFERIENGDFNWIIPKKILAFCGPHNNARFFDGYPRHCPESYFPYFSDNNVSTVIRLNSKVYNSMRFVNAGFQHLDLFFVDGSLPSNEIIRRFIRAVEDAPGAVAVHCKAGLGRTGTLIACYMMYKYKISAPESISWVRICRPGSVIGPQQQFLIEDFKERLLKRFRPEDEVVIEECTQGDKLLAVKAKMAQRKVKTSVRGGSRGRSTSRSRWSRQRHCSKSRYRHVDSRGHISTRGSSSRRGSSRIRSRSVRKLNKSVSRSCSKTVVTSRSHKSVLETMKTTKHLTTITMENERNVKRRKTGHATRQVSSSPAQLPL